MSLVNEIKKIKTNNENLFERHAKAIRISKVIKEKEEKGIIFKKLNKPATKGDVERCCGRSNAMRK